ncbi:MAG: hypothetical protein OHK0046_13530 [Anaerolineae bacterium]
MKKLTVFVMIVALFSLMVASVSAQDPIRLGSNAASLANIFEVSEGYEVWRYEPEMEQADYAFLVTWDEVEDGTALAEANGEAVLLAEYGDVAFYALPTGECQVNSPMVDGPLYEFTFGC